jgi:hypothetical protein
VLFDPQRAARLVEYHARDPQLITFEAVMHATLAVTRPSPERRRKGPAALAVAVQDAVYVRTVEALLALAANPAAAATVRAAVYHALQSLKAVMPGTPVINDYVARRIDQFARNPEKFTVAVPIEAPPGMPIGSDD